MIPPSVATIAVLAIGLFVPIGHAQVNAPPASVTSPGFGGRPINGTPPSVTSLGPHGFAPQIPLAPVPNGIHHNDGQHHRRHDGERAAPLYAYPVPYAVPVPYADGYLPTDNDSDDVSESDEYQGGPTVFDRRGSGESSYVPPMRNVRPAHASDPDDPPADPGPPQPPTLLVFKDGHKLELGNYAIVGTTVFDLTPGHPRRIALADLDLDATRLQNDERGVTFQVPAPQQAN